jgi:hypothetical protein
MIPQSIHGPGNLSSYPNILKDQAYNCHVISIFSKSTEGIGYVCVIIPYSVDVAASQNSFMTPVSTLYKDQNPYVTTAVRPESTGKSCL